MHLILKFAVVLVLTYHIPHTTYHCLYAAFQDNGWGVRPLGMGYAFTAVADDANGPLFNPAGAAQAEKAEATFSSARLFTGLEGVEIVRNYFCCLQPLGRKAGNTGAAWTSLYTPGLYTEDTFILTYANDLNDFVALDPVRVLAGANIKYLSHRYDLDERTKGDPVFRDASEKGSFDADLGVIVQLPDDDISVGLASRNITQADVGLLTSDKVVLENVLGVAYSFDLGSSGGRYKPLLLALDVVNRDNEFIGRFGAEKWLARDHIAVRAGYNMRSVTAGFGYRVELWSTLGFGIDYAFEWPLEIEHTTGTHRLGIILR